MNKYYFAGGMYWEEDNKKMSFDAVSPSNGLPYITTDKNGLVLTSHHSSLYQLSDDLSEAFLVDYRQGGQGQSPRRVKLSEKLSNEFKQVIEQGRIY